MLLTVFLPDVAHGIEMSDVERASGAATVGLADVAILREFQAKSNAQVRFARGLSQSFLGRSLGT